MGLALSSFPASHERDLLPHKSSVCHGHEGPAAGIAQDRHSQEQDLLWHLRHQQRARQGDQLHQGKRPCRSPESHSRGRGMAEVRGRAPDEAGESVGMRPCPEEGKPRAPCTLGPRRWDSSQTKAKEGPWVKALQRCWGLRQTLCLAQESAVSSQGKEGAREQWH